MTPVRPIPTSLMSGATARTVKPSFVEGLGVATRRRPRFSVGLVALGAIAALLGVIVAKKVAPSRTRPELVMQIVSGSPVLKKGSDGASVRWHSNQAKLYLDSSLDSLSAHARDAVQLGFGTWLSSGAKLPTLSFDSTSGAKFGTTPDGKSEIMYGPITIAGHENDLALTVVFSDPTTGEVLEADMMFNSNHEYGLLSARGDSNDGESGPGNTNTVNASSAATTSCNNEYDLQNVATHEAGHFFGLGEDYDVKTATMFYTTGRCETNKRVLQSTDESTMDALYLTSAATSDSSTDPSTDTGKGCGGARIGQGKTGGEASLAALVGLLGFVSWRRRRR